MAISPKAFAPEAAPATVAPLYALAPSFRSRLRRHRLAQVGLVIIALLVFVALGDLKQPSALTVALSTATS